MCAGVSGTGMNVMTAPVMSGIVAIGTVMTGTVMTGAGMTGTGMTGTVMTGTGMTVIGMIGTGKIAVSVVVMAGAPPRSLGRVAAPVARQRQQGQQGQRHRWPVVRPLPVVLLVARIWWTQGSSVS